MRGTNEGKIMTYEEGSFLKKRGLSLLLCVLMVLHFMPIGLAGAGADSNTVYSMMSDPDIQGRAIGDTFEGTTWLQRSGSPTLTIVDNNGSKAISVTGRTSDWYCIDLKNLDSLPDGFDYTITVTGSTAEGEKMKLSQPRSPYGTHISQVTGSDGAFTLERTFTYAELQAEKMIRIQSEGTIKDYTIHSIIITQTAASGPATTPTPIPGKTIDDIHITFSAADYEKWGGSFTSDENNVVIEWATDFGKDDTYALKGTHLSGSSDYNSANNAIRLTFDEPLAKDAIYTVSYSVYCPTFGNEGKDILTGPGIVLNGDYAGATGTSKFPANYGTIDLDTWKEVTVTTPANGLNYTLQSIDFRFVVNDEPKHPDVWYIDDIRISQQIIDVGDTTPNYKEFTPLKDAYKDYFLIGTTSGNSRMSGDKLDIIKYHFNAFTPENEMKPESIQRTKGAFTYNTLDEQLAKVQGMNIIGHTLAWHSQTPRWMWGDPPLSAAEAKANMDAHIENVLGRYGAILTAIDVVNEAMADGRNNADWRLNLRNTEGWYLALGSEWVEYAFLKAAEIVDANGWDCKLYYNDYNLDYIDKATSVYNMVKDINERYAGVRPNGKPLIEGIGMQAHYNQNTVPANVENSIKLFSTLPGVSISITELDVTYSNTGSLTEQQLQRQAVKYAQLFDIFRKYAAGPANNNNGRIERVTLWGTNDGDSWRGQSYPLLFDKNLRAKEALKAVLDPDEYLKDIVIPDEYSEAKSVYGTPRLGTNDSIWNRSPVIHVNKKPIEQDEPAGATAVVKTLWDDHYFYVRAEVTDPKLDATSANPWEQDSVEVFFGETAYRTNRYVDGDGQYRVGFDGKESFKSAGMGEGFSSYAEVTDTGYMVEMKIPFRVISPAHGTAVSFDVQINDVSSGASTRKLTVWSDLYADGYNSTERWGLLHLSGYVDGVHVYDTYMGDEWSGANIILGNDADVWPWSTAGADGKMAFTPEKDATYRFTVTYKALGTNAIRMRWVKDATNGGYTAQDSSVVGASPSLGPSEIATSIPVYFNRGMTTNNTYTLVAEIKLDGNQPADGLIGNLAIRGGAGGNNFSITAIKVEKVGSGGVPDTLLVSWPVSPIAYTATANGSPNTSTSTAITLVFDRPVPGLTTDDIIITDGTAKAVKGDLTLVEGSNNTQYNLSISGVDVQGTIQLKVTKEGVDNTVKTVTVYKMYESTYTPVYTPSSAASTPKPTATPTPAPSPTPVPAHSIKPVNISNEPVDGELVETPEEALVNARIAFARNPGVIRTSSPITVAAPPETNKGLTPVRIPLPPGTAFTALVSPNKDGSFTPVPVYTGEDGSVYVFIDESKTLIPVTIRTVFRDVPEDEWFAGAVQNAAEMAIIFGYGNNRFGPNDTTTNQQTVTMLMRTVGYNAEYDSVLQTAADRGIGASLGLNDNDYTSRATTAVLIKDILASIHVDVDLTESEIAGLLAPFNDLDGLSDEQMLSFAVAVKYGILKGTYVGEDYSLMGPDILLTRAQISMIAIRLVEFITK